jgi:DNA-binding transcriptional MerR regulator
MGEKRFTVSQVAALAHVTVRTLHHYHEIGLLVPSQRSGKGYRLYSPPDLERLHQILLFRELGFTLEGIQQLLEATAYDRAAALRAQRGLLEERIQRTRAVMGAVDNALRSLQGETTMNEETMFEGFEGFDHAQHADEARQRWGETEAYQESMRRAKQYTREDWARMKEEGEAIEVRLAELLQASRPADSAEAMDAVEAHRQHMERWFYPVSHAMHVGLARMYTSDPRFQAHYDDRAPGLAAFVEAAVQANAKRAGA